MNIEHDQQKRRFQTNLEAGTAYIEYDDSSEGSLDLQHTIVPEAHEGKGVASALAKHAFEYARENDLSIIPTCPFIATWVSRNPDYQDVIAAE